MTKKIFKTFLLFVFFSACLQLACCRRSGHKIILTGGKFAFDFLKIRSFYRTDLLKTLRVSRDLPWKANKLKLTCFRTRRRWRRWRRWRRISPFASSPGSRPDPVSSSDPGDSASSGVHRKAGASLPAGCWSLGVRPESLRDVRGARRGNASVLQLPVLQSLVRHLSW